MKKCIYPLLLILLLCGCESNPSNSVTNNPSTSISASTSVPSDSTSSNVPSQTTSAGSMQSEIQAFAAKLDFSSVVNKFSGYENHSVVMDEINTKNNSSTPVLVSFDNTSKQANKITDVPVLKAADNDDHAPKYITLLSDTEYNITEASFALSIYANSDVANVGEDYYLGLEYEVNNEFKRLESIDVTTLDVGARLSSLMFTFDITEANVHNLRIAFDFPNATAPIRFGAYELAYQGSRCVYKTSDIKDIALETSTLSLNVGETNTITYATTPSNLNKYLTFSSDNRAVAVVNEVGKIEALSAGKANIIIQGGNISKTITVDVLEGNHQKIIQENVEFNEIPAGFTSNFNTFFNGTYLNFKAKDNYVLTPVYDINGPTTVILTMKLSSSASIEDSSKNVFTIIGLDETGKEVEKVQKEGLINLDFEEISFDFLSNEIAQYKIIFETKFNYGKNYVLKSLIIYEN